MPSEKQPDWREAIQLNLNCGCSLGKCVKCAPILLLFETSILRERERIIDLVVAMLDKELRNHPCVEESHCTTADCFLIHIGREEGLSNLLEKIKK